jgi:hypothetical protein
MFSWTSQFIARAVWVQLLYDPASANRKPYRIENYLPYLIAKPSNWHIERMPIFNRFNVDRPIL